ncbi:MAG: hypothetical protein IPJ81_02035 [Chitinophagaceae bacterium]|nr:hypothetical protein [Chitinophagaceae bacterium]
MKFIYLKIWFITAFINGLGNGYFLYSRKFLFSRFIPAAVTVFIFSLALALPAVLFMWECVQRMKKKGEPGNKTLSTAIKTASMVSIPAACMLYLMVYGINKKQHIDIEFLSQLLSGLFHY